MSKLKRTSDVTKNFDLRKAHELPYYYIENNPYCFLRLVAYAKQRPLGFLQDKGERYVLFKYTREIKYIDKYIEDYQFSAQEWNELLESLNSQDLVYYGLLKDMERIKKEYSREDR